MMDHRRLSNGMLDFVDQRLLERQARKTAGARNALAGARRRLSRAVADGQAAEEAVHRKLRSTLDSIESCFSSYPLLHLTKPVDQVTTERKALAEAYFQFGPEVFTPLRTYKHRDVRSSVIVANYLAAACLAISAYEDPLLLSRLVRIGLGFEPSPHKTAINAFLTERKLTSAVFHQQSWQELSMRFKAGDQQCADSNLPQAELLSAVTLRDRLRRETGIITTEEEAARWPLIDTESFEHIDTLSYPMVRREWNLYPEWLKTHLTEQDRELIDHLRVTPIQDLEISYVSDTPRPI